MSVLLFVTQSQKEQCDLIKQTSRHETIQTAVRALKTGEKASVKVEEVCSL